MTKEINFEALNKARKILGLNDICTIEEIKTAYREAMQRYHPDKNRSDNNAHWKTIELIHAYELIVQYCQNYKFSFKKEDFLKQDSSIFDNSVNAEYYDWWKNHYGNPLFGGDI